MSLRREQPNRYKRVNKESYILFLDWYIYFLEEKKERKSKIGVMQREWSNKHQKNGKKN